MEKTLETEKIPVTGTGAATALVSLAASAFVAGVRSRQSLHEPKDQMLALLGVIDAEMPEVTEELNQNLPSVVAEEYNKARKRGR